MLDDKELKTKIMNSINDDDIPNFSTAIKAKYEAKKESKKPWYKSKALWGFGVPILACGIVAAIIIPQLGLNNKIDEIITTPMQIQGKKNEIAFGVLSGANLIPDKNIGPSLRSKQNISKDQFEKEITTLNPYISTAEAMLDSNLDIAPIIVESDLTEYTYKMQINNAGEILTFYYNEISEKAAKIDDNDDEEDEDDDNEQEFELAGIFKKDGITYDVEGSKELEEDEYELTLKIYLNESKKDYILIEQEFEQSKDEQESSYLYSIVENGNSSFAAEISFEQEDNETKVDIELKNASFKSCYKISKSNKNLLIEYEINGYDEGNIKVMSSISDNEIFYTYIEEKLGYQLILKRV